MTLTLHDSGGVGSESSTTACNCKFTKGPWQGTNHPGVQLQTQGVGDGAIHSPARDDVTNQLALASRWSWSSARAPSLPLSPALSFFCACASLYPLLAMALGAPRVRVRNARKGYEEKEVVQFNFFNQVSFFHQIRTKIVQIVL